MKGIKYF